MLRETALTLLLLCFVPFQDSCRSQQAQDQSYIPGQILVKFHEGVSKEEAHTLHDRLGSTILVHYQKLNIDLVKIKSGLTVEESIKLYQEDSRVVYAEPNCTRRKQPTKRGDTP
jgi:thermitase